MMWSDKKIKEAIKTGLINIEPFDESMLQPNSIDLKLDDEILMYDPNFFVWDKVNILDYDRAWLHPNAFILASTVEKVTLGNGVCAQVDGKSSYGRKGLQIHQTAGFIDAGFSGNITLEMYSVGESILLNHKMPIAQLIFWDAYPSENPYGSPKLNSHYQNQEKVTRSYL